MTGYTRVCVHTQAEAAFHSDPGRSLKGWLWRWDLNDMKEPARRNMRTVYSPGWRHSKSKGPEARTDVGTQRTEDTAGGSEREGEVKMSVRGLVVGGEGSECHS